MCINDDPIMKASIKHPSEFLPAIVTDQIRNDAFNAEQEKNLTVTQRDVMLEQKWLNMYVPKGHGGLGLSFPEILRIEESLSWADGSTGWVVTLCSGAAWFVGFLNNDLAKSIFLNDTICFAGSGAVTGIANKTLRGYEIEGYWKYATGSLFATVFTVNCQVKENGVLLFQPDGTPVVQSLLLKKDEVIVHKTWSSMGMVATGSHSIEIKNVIVPFDRTFIIQAAHATLPDPIFQYPFLQLAETTLAVNLSGMACRFFDLCAAIFSKKEGSAKIYFQKLHDSRLILDELRSAFYYKTDEAWQSLVSNALIPDDVLNEVSNLSHELVARCRDLVNVLYPYCGLEAANTQNEINRVWRNFHTAGQHSLFRNQLKL
jgi:indole-3-acetate monooxygenase